MKFLFEKHQWKGLLQKPFLKVLTVFITNKCNARCATCFYWQELNTKVQDLTLEEYQSIADKMPAFNDLLVSGGEPTLAPHLVDMVDLFLQRPAQSLTMPTNGLKPDQISGKVDEICTRKPDNRVVIGVSLDGIGELHDEIRGVPGNYEKAIETLRQLHALKPKHPNLRLTSLTCVNNENEHETRELLQEMARMSYVDYVTVEPLRGEPPKEGMGPPSVYQMKKIHEMQHNLNMQLLGRKHPLEAPLMLSHIRTLHREQHKVLETGRLGIDCLAGEVLGVLEVDGQVRLCELLEPIGNLRDHDFDFEALWWSEKANEQRRYIKSKACSCTHCVNLSQSLPFHFWPELERLFDQRQLEREIGALQA